MGSSKLFNVEWDRAACKDKPLKLFFSNRLSDQEEAKGVCSLCPIRQECLDWALDNTERGIWGGMTLQERCALDTS